MWLYRDLFFRNLLQKKLSNLIILEGLMSHSHYDSLIQIKIPNT